MRAAPRALASLLAACGASDSPDTDAATATTSATSSDAPTSSASSTSSDTGNPDPPAGGCAPEALADPPTDRTYYVAIAEPGASNDACDGLAPTDEGGGRCPFKDLTAPAVQGLLDGARSTRLALRAGTYVVSGWDGLRVAGTGTSDAERVVLSSYQGEPVTLDVPAPDGVGCTAADAPDDPQCVRQVVRVSGEYTTVQGLTIRNGLGYNLEVTGGAHHQVRCNHFTETVDFPMRSDSLKLDAGAFDVEILANEFSRWRSQAIDVTGVHDIVIEANEFHDPHDADGGAVGCKFGAADVTIRGNTIRDLGSSPQAHAFSLGGTGSAHPDDAAAYRIRVVANHVSGAQGLLAQLVACQDCSVEDNVVLDVGAGVLLSAAATGAPECSAAPAGCAATTAARITGNRMRGLHGAGDPASANIFIVVEPGEATGLVAGDNVYCAPADAHRFGWLGDLLPFPDWVAAAATDATSQALPEADPACAFD